MKLSDLKIMHIILILSVLAWVYLFFDWQKTKYQLGFQNWQGQVTQVIGQLNTRLGDIERKLASSSSPPLQQPSPPVRGK